METRAAKILFRRWPEGFFFFLNPETLTNWNGKDRWLIIHRVEGEVGDEGRGRIKNDSKPEPQ